MHEDKIERGKQSLDRIEKQGSITRKDWEFVGAALTEGKRISKETKGLTFKQWREDNDFGEDRLSNAEVSDSIWLASEEGKNFYVKRKKMSYPDLIRREFRKANRKERPQEPKKKKPLDLNLLKDELVDWSTAERNELIKYLRFLNDADKAAA